MTVMISGVDQAQVMNQYNYNILMNDCQSYKTLDSSVQGNNTICVS